MLFGRKNKPSGQAPVGLVDLHCHILAGVDDGAQNDEKMYELIALEYNCGVRHLCFTPHYNPALFEPRPQKIAESFENAKNYVLENFPDMNLYLGNEVYMRPDTVERLRDRSCKPLGDSRVVLTEFHPETSFQDIRLGVVKLLSNAKIPLIAHIERYDNLNSQEQVDELKSLGAKLQINTEAFDTKKSRFISQLVKHGYIDAVADDRHGLTRGNPNLKECYEFIDQKFGKMAAEALFIRRPLNILNMA